MESWNQTFVAISTAVENVTDTSYRLEASGRPSRGAEVLRGVRDAAARGRAFVVKKNRPAGWRGGDQRAVLDCVSARPVRVAARS